MFDHGLPLPLFIQTCRYAEYRIYSISLRHKTHVHHGMTDIFTVPEYIRIHACITTKEDNTKACTMTAYAASTGDLTSAPSASEFKVRRSTIFMIYGEIM